MSYTVAVGFLTLKSVAKPKSDILTWPASSKSTLAGCDKVIVRHIISKSVAESQEVIARANISIHVHTFTYVRISTYNAHVRKSTCKLNILTMSF